MAVRRGVLVIVLCVFVTAYVTGLVFSFPLLGGALNRGRGGWVNFYGNDSSRNDSSDCRPCLSYWPAHLCKNLLFAVPTGVVMLFLSCHLRGSLFVTVMTWASLYVGWGTYMSVGSSPGDYLSRSGVFDWLLGRQLNANWTFQQRFIREYSGMSLRGLVWTAPPGYALQQLGFGWEYSLSGSLMGLFYFIGTHTPVVSSNSSFRHTFDGGIAYSEFYWGWWVWLVLIVSSITQLTRRMRVWVYTKDAHLGYHPFTVRQVLLYRSLNRYPTRWSYEAVMVAFNLVLCCSAVYYSLVEQEDVRNKGQTFFGLFVSILFLTLAQGWVWGMAWMKRQMKKATKNRNAMRRYSPSPEQNVETVLSETQPLLGPSSSERSSPQLDRSNTLYLPEGGPADSFSVQQQTGRTPALAKAWYRVEQFLWLDVFVITRRVLGLIILLSVASVVVTTVIAVVHGWHTPRYVYLVDEL